jgi:hypothetical protein
MMPTLPARLQSVPPGVGRAPQAVARSCILAGIAHALAVPTSGVTFLVLGFAGAPALPHGILLAQWTAREQVPVAEVIGHGGREGWSDSHRRMS